MDMEDIRRLVDYENTVIDDLRKIAKNMDIHKASAYYHEGRISFTRHDIEDLIRLAEDRLIREEYLLLYVDSRPA